MLLTESEGKGLLASVGVRIPDGFEARVAQELHAAPISFPVAVKAQVASGGRGLAGGVARCGDLAEAEAALERIMTMTFGGASPSAVLVEPWLPIARELYLAVAIDGRAGGFTVLYAPAGGVVVERGDGPTMYEVGLPRNFRAHRLRALLETVEPDARVRERVTALARRMLRLAEGSDCTTVEINPLVVLDDGSLVAADAKVVIDDSAAFRHAYTRERLAAARAAEPEDIRRCQEEDLMLVWLDGDVGLLSGGAGMTMGAMDAIEAAGGEAACFLDCSGNPTPAGFSLALDLLEHSPRVRSILISIFGGGLQVDRVARTLIEVLGRGAVTKPVVFRLDGTRSDRARELLAGAGYHNHATLETAVTQAVADARRERAA